MMTIEDTTLGIDRLRQALAEVWRGWSWEWKRLAWEIRGKLSPTQSLPVVWFDDLGAAVVRSSGDGLERRHALAAGDEDGSSPISRLLVGGSAVTVVEVPDTEVLRPGIRLPRTRHTILRKILHFELSRLSPLDPGDVYFDFRTGSAPNSDANADVLLRIVRRATVDRAVAMCHAAGLSVASIRFEGDPEPADWRSFPIDRNAFFWTEVRRLSIPALCGLAALLFLLILAAAYARGNAVSDDIAGQIGSARREASITRHLRTEVQDLIAQQSFLGNRKQAPLAGATIAELSRILPDDTWLTNLQLTGAKARMQGYSHAASSLIARIDGSRDLGNAQFEAPLTRDSAENGERFDVAFEVRQ
jgi:general secretion pathway protein L